ncbi:unnamed protein product [Lymnaea stagnalis]|uniref:SLC12A transporter C-terminal domain-containing protein n=1 Tax=Lymnaea stagnalis TaxID=6523 RepID=A0AAV2HEF5_LYMST
MEMSECDMSAYVYERTLKLEERTRMLNFMSKRFRKISSLGFGKKNLMEKEVQSVFEQARAHLQEDISTPIDAYSRKTSILPSHENIRHMTTAVTLNSMMKEKSGNANLIILNLPCVPETSTGQANYMSFLEEITMGLKRMLLVRGTGSEVITVYN